MLKQWWVNFGLEVIRNILWEFQLLNKNTFSYLLFVYLFDLWLIFTNCLRYILWNHKIQLLKKEMFWILFVISLFTTKFLKKP